MHGYSLKFTIGMVLLLTNQVIGWAGLIIGGWLGKKTGKKIYYAIGTVTYGLSWGMVALGAYLAGPEGVALFKKLFRTYMWQTIGAGAVLVAGAAVYYFIIRKRK